MSEAPEYIIQVQVLENTPASGEELARLTLVYGNLCKVTSCIQYGCPQYLEKTDEH